MTAPLPPSLLPNASVIFSGFLKTVTMQQGGGLGRPEYLLEAQTDDGSLLRGRILPITIVRHNGVMPEAGDPVKWHGGTGSACVTVGNGRDLFFQVESVERRGRLFEHVLDHAGSAQGKSRWIEMPSLHSPPKPLFKEPPAPPPAPKREKPRRLVSL